MGQAEKQLREKISDLYGKIADNYEKPSSAEMRNLTVLEDSFNKAKETYTTINKEAINDILNEVSKAKLETVKYKSFEEFVEDK